MIVKDIMTCDVACLKADDSVEKAAQLMKQYDVGSIPICDNNKIIGIVTDRDIAVRSVAQNHDTSCQKVYDIMTSNPVVGTCDMEVHQVAKLMSERQIRRLPIVENNNLVGMVSLGDISVEPKLQDNAEWALKNISEKTY